MNNIPTYEELKEIKTYKTYDIFFPVFGGYFRLTINEHNERNIALDYLEGGYLCGIIRKFNSEYTFSKLYKFNKKNYNGLLKLYKEMLEVAYRELGEQLKNNA